MLAESELIKSEEESYVENRETLFPEEEEDTHSDAEVLDELLDITIHPSVAIPLVGALDEKEDEIIFIDPSIGEGKRILSEPETTIPELFAIMRQFLPPVSSNLDLVVNEMIKRNIGLNDIDTTTGFTMLHYVIRSELNTKNINGTISIINNLLEKGADPFIRSLYSDLNAIHISAYYDCPNSLTAVLKYIARHYKSEIHIDSLCSSYSYGTPLHIAAACISSNAASVLIKFGANLFATDDCGKKPIECIPEKVKGQTKESINELQQMLLSNMRSADEAISLTPRKTSKQNKRRSKDDLSHLDLKVGSEVILAGTKQGILRFIGTVEFSTGIWCGVELNERIGRNDGSINGVRYFTCQPDRGVFAPPSKVAISQHKENIPTRRSYSSNDLLDSISDDQKKSVHFATKSSSEISPRTKKTSLKIGMAVKLDSHSEHGVIRFIGKTSFAEGVWVGLELSRPIGKNDGIVQGHRYFTCKLNHGIMVRPQRVTLRGVPGSDLLPPKLQ